MIFSVEKRRFRQNGELRETRCYHLRYRLGDMPIDRWKSLGVTDKQVAEKKAREFIQEQEREAAGILEPRVIRDAAKKLVKDHLEDYVGDLERRGRSQRGERDGGRSARQVQRKLRRETSAQCRSHPLGADQRGRPAGLVALAHALPLI
jgi:hypothetical protein